MCAWGLGGVVWGHARPPKKRHQNKTHHTLAPTPTHTTHTTHTPTHNPHNPHTPPKHARQLGITTFASYPLEAVLDYIDWNPFFQVWQLRGRYPNRGYPKIFNDAAVGGEARKLFDEAQEMLADFVKRKRVTLNGVVAVWPAAGAGDDIEVYASEARDEVAAKFYGLRQQAEKEEAGEPYLCLSDFVAPASSGVADYLNA